MSRSPRPTGLASTAAGRTACRPAGSGTVPAPLRSPVAARCPGWPACQGRAGSPRRGAPISTPCAGRRPGARRTRGRSSAAPRAGRGSRARSTVARCSPGTASLLLSMQARSSRALHRKCDGSTTRGHWPRLREPGCSVAETLPGGREAHGAHHRAAAGAGAGRLRLPAPDGSMPGPSRRAQQGTGRILRAARANTRGGVHRHRRRHRAGTRLHRVCSTCSPRSPATGSSFPRGRTSATAGQPGPGSPSSLVPAGA